MEKEDSHAGKKMCRQHPLPKSPLTSSHVPAHQQKSSPQTQHSRLLIMSTNYHCHEFLLPDDVQQSPHYSDDSNTSTHSSSSSTAADTPGTTQTFGAKLTVDAV